MVEQEGIAIECLCQGGQPAYCDKRYTCAGDRPSLSTCNPASKDLQAAGFEYTQRVAECVTRLIGKDIGYTCYIAQAALCRRFIELCPHQRQIEPRRGTAGNRICLTAKLIRTRHVQRLDADHASLEDRA